MKPAELTSLETGAVDEELENAVAVGAAAVEEDQ